MLHQKFEVTERIYRSRFRSWNTRSAVRSKPLPEFAGTNAKLFFTPELVPLIDHPLISGRGDEVVHQVITRHLLGHLNFTDTLENEVVTPVAYMIGRRQLDFGLPAAMLVDARKIAVDEMHHALFAAGFVEEISLLSGVDPLPAQRPSFLLELDTIKSCCESRHVPLVMLFFAIISETLITSTLTRVPNDERVVAGVRTILGDHAEDEARHHLYFTDVLTACWPRLTAVQRALVGPLLPRFISMFLAPDLLDAQGCLAALGFPADLAERIMEEVYPGERIASEVRAKADSVVRLMGRAGVLEDQRTFDSFHKFGLL
ncbi:MAG: P-aminobenzoate N-oxygenase AurF [Bradyrhizobium sp.]|nr:P-aminobenzoate N-oxygenase AurF [Bradyrhizobium sp.]